MFSSSLLIRMLISITTALYIYPPVVLVLLVLMTGAPHGDMALSLMYIDMYLVSFFMSLKVDAVLAQKLQ